MLLIYSKTVKFVNRLLGALTLGLMVTGVQAQTRIDVDKTKESLTLSHWKLNPDLLFRYTSPDSYEAASWYKFRFGELKAAADKNGAKNEAGIYYENLFGGDNKKFFGAGLEITEDKGALKRNLEAYYIFPLNRHNISMGYSHALGRSTVTVGDFFGYRKVHIGSALAVRNTDSGEAFYKRYITGLLLGVEGRYKGFLRLDDTNASYTGFLRFGTSEFQRTFTPNAFYIDNKILVQQLFCSVRNQNFDDSPLAFIHPSEMGRFVVVTRYNRSESKNSEVIEVYHADNKKYPIIVGASFQRNYSGSVAKYSADGNIGTVIGPVRIVGNLGSNNGIYLSLKIK